MKLLCTFILNIVSTCLFLNFSIRPCVKAGRYAVLFIANIFMSELSARGVPDATIVWNITSNTPTVWNISAKTISDVLNIINKKTERKKRVRRSEDNNSTRGSANTDQNNNGTQGSANKNQNNNDTQGSTIVDVALADIGKDLPQETILTTQYCKNRTDDAPSNTLNMCPDCGYLITLPAQ